MSVMGVQGDSRAALEEGVIRSLWFLYQEVVKGGAQELASIVEATIQDCEAVICESAPATVEHEDLLHQFYVLRTFRRLDSAQKQAVVRAIEELDDGP